ncbi:tubulin--tyrosine ligase-like protein 12 [Thrips palmi]|uniref:Tubulin--tyrosine ligase-like protein 12 n=1 Tax=Thrips palmi TaxID=161013 RepID=A0A6P9A0F2_THRPL|nr:tubulin--tyrosine ligase-like protein 12 [Thrips palmi]
MDSLTFEDFLTLHKPQLELAAVPQHLWETLFQKLVNQVFDAGEKFSMYMVDYESKEREEGDPVYSVFVSTQNGISASDPSHIYLIDHAWTFTASDAQKHLRHVPGLLERMARLMGCDEDVSVDEAREFVSKYMWNYSQTYSVANNMNVEDRLPVWYIMDEFGSAIQHSSDPNFRVVPFVFSPEQVTYSILFPIRDVELNGEVTRNFIEGCLQTDSDSKKALLIPWFPNEFTNQCFVQEEPAPKYFLDGHEVETLPDLDILTQTPKDNDKTKVWKVFAEYKYIHEYLNHPQFVFIDNETDADILWTTTHFKKFKELSESTPHKFINQFPFEHVLTVKDLLSVVCRRKLGKGVKTYDEDTLETFPSWLPTTFNLKTELPKFVSYYQQREEKGLDNLWICKPWNLARGLDMHVTDNLRYILRLPFSGPKIAQKYLHNPVLFCRPDIGRVKFDVRYVVLLKSVKPLEVYAYRNFFLRFANKSFDLSEFDDYEKHFTVMNYTEAQLCKMLHNEFIDEFEKQYPSHPWKEVEKDIFEMLREVFECAALKAPPCGIAPSPQSRAVYAVDLMLDWQHCPRNKDKIQPKLLEINWTPDCRRACEYYPNFYNDIFSLLFLDTCNEDVFVSL